MNNTIVFPTTYLGSIQYYTHLVQQTNVIEMEVHTPYQKKSYRNRGNIIGANGRMSLSVPIVHQSGEIKLLKDTLISYDTPWLKQHWRSIISAYNSSPFFEYYQDVFVPIYENRHKYLIDLNLKLTEVILEEIGAEIELSTTSEKSEDTTYRFLANPKLPLDKDPHFCNKAYRQVFAEKHAFEPNLSIIDLLFNKGPETLSWLEESFFK